MKISPCYCHNFQQTYQEMKKMYNAQKKPMDLLKEQIEQLLGDLGEEASKTPNKNKDTKNTLTKHKVRDPDVFDYRTLATFRKCLEREGITLTFSM